MEGTFAFAAQFWGDGAVVCRAIQDRPGPLVEQQFGKFPTWSQANAFAAKLNEGMDLDPLDAREIVTSSLLATACVIQEALNSPWQDSHAAQAVARAARLQFILAELRLAFTFCRFAGHLSEAAARRNTLHIRRALLDSARFLETFEGDRDQLQNVVSHTEELKSALEAVSTSLKEAQNFPGELLQASAAHRPPRLLIDCFASPVASPALS